MGIAYQRHGRLAANFRACDGLLTPVSGHKKRISTALQTIGGSRRFADTVESRADGYLNGLPW